MSLHTEKHKAVIEEAIARLLARAENSRQLEISDLFERVASALEKYLFRYDENASASDVREFIGQLRADDLCLILACERGDEAAWDELVKTQDSTVKSAARKISGSAEEAEDLASSIWAELYGLKRGEDGKPKTKLSYYSGRGSLAGWLRAVVSQLAIDHFRRESKFVQIEENREFENLAEKSAEKIENSAVVAHKETPEEIFSEKQTARDVSEALKEAVAALEAEDRLILKLYYFDDLKLKEIGTALGFHEATASRKLVRIQTEIRKSVEKILRQKHGWSEEEVKRYLSETASKLGISFEKMLALAIAAAIVQDIVGAGVL
jgi:RNA polymerase sigma factor, sigma-70 family